MNENLLSIEKRSSISGTFWKKRFDNDYKEVGDIILDSKKYKIYSKRDFKGTNNSERKYLEFINYNCYYRSVSRH